MFFTRLVCWHVCPLKAMGKFCEIFGMGIHVRGHGTRNGRADPNSNSKLDIRIFFLSFSTTLAYFN